MIFAALIETKFIQEFVRVHNIRFLIRFSDETPNGSLIINQKMHILINNCCTRTYCLDYQHMNPYSLSLTKNTKVKKTTLITHRIIIIIDGNLFQNCILLPHTHTHIYPKYTPSMLFFLHFTCFWTQKEKKRNRKTFKIDVVKRYVRDSLSHYLMLFLT